jgi:type III effector protein AvrRpm1
MPQELQSLAKQVYRDTVLWHGTSQASKVNIQASGFDTRNKRPGATQGVENRHEVDPAFKARASGYNYFTSHRDIAKKYARTASPDSPALVRTIGIRSGFGLELDPDSKVGGKVSPFAARTTSRIPTEHVLGSKKDSAGPSARIFQQELRHAGADVSTKMAGELLKEAQTDSEDDFGGSDDEGTHY